MDAIDGEWFEEMGWLIFLVTKGGVDVHYLDELLGGSDRRDSREFATSLHTLFLTRHVNYNRRLTRSHYVSSTFPIESPAPTDDC